METPRGKRVWREEPMAKPLELWPHDVIEEAVDGVASASVADLVA